jgi:urea-proton symporter
MPLYGTKYVFSKPFFRLWVVWTFAWAWISGLVITLLPLWQGRHTLQLILSYTFWLRSPTPESEENTSGMKGLDADSQEDDEKKLPAS